MTDSTKKSEYAAIVKKHKHDDVDLTGVRSLNQQEGNAHFKSF